MIPCCGLRLHEVRKVSILLVIPAVAYPGIFSGGGGGSTNSERGSGGGSPLVRGSGGRGTLVQEISVHIINVA
jgi:hypothetical protein